MTVLIENAYELEVIAREIGAICLKGQLRYPSETGGWTLSVVKRQGAEALGDLDLNEYVSPSVTPAKFRDRRLVLVVAPVSEVEPATVTCGICGFVLMAETTAPGGALQARYVHTNLLNGCGFKLALPVQSGAAG